MRSALITGGGRRIGAAIALKLARAGFAVVLHAHRSREEAEQIAAEIKSEGGRASIVLADLADQGSGARPGASGGGVRSAVAAGQ